MCLTEPQCGTDLGLIRTKAEPKGMTNGTGGPVEGLSLFSNGRTNFNQNFIFKDISGAKTIQKLPHFVKHRTFYDPGLSGIFI